MLPAHETAYRARLATELRMVARDFASALAGLVADYIAAAPRWMSNDQADWLVAEKTSDAGACALITGGGCVSQTPFWPGDRIRVTVNVSDNHPREAQRLEFTASTLTAERVEGRVVRDNNIEFEVGIAALRIEASPSRWVHVDSGLDCNHISNAAGYLVFQQCVPRIGGLLSYIDGYRPISGQLPEGIPQSIELERTQTHVLVHVDGCCITLAPTPPHALRFLYVWIGYSRAGPRSATIALANVHTCTGAFLPVA